MPDDQPSSVQLRSPRFYRIRPVWFIAAALLSALIVVGGVFEWKAASRSEPIVVAFANSMTGSLALVGEETRIATQLYLDEVNASGGIDGRLVKLEIFDDESNPPTAGANVSAILASPAVAVLGHSATNTSVGAAKGYKDGHIAAVAGYVSGDEITQDNPYYFRALSPNTSQAEFLSQYLHTVVMSRTSTFMRAPDIDLVTTDLPFGRSFRAGFQRGETGAGAKLFKVEPGENLEISAELAAERLALEPEPRIIILGVATDTSAPVLRAIRRRGIHSMLILASSAASDAFAQQFDNEPEERDEPGFFTDNVFAIAPMIPDNTGAAGQALVSEYQNITGKRASWFAACAHDAVRILVEAIRRANIGHDKATLSADREKIRDSLAAIDRPENAVMGINGPLWFDAKREMPRAMRYGYFREGRFLSAPLQLVHVADRDLVDIGKEIELAHMVQIGEQFYWLQRVVHTGIDITHLNRIDIKEGTFNADFYLWMRYADGDDLPTQIEFSGFSGSFDINKPLQSGVEDGLDYRLWRVSGNFKANFDLHDYPFDTQKLLIRLQNRDHPREQISYAIDTFGLRLDRQGLSAGSGDAFRDLQLWQLTGVRPFVDSFSVQSTLGKPALFSTANRTEFGRFDTEISVRRNVVAFMVKALVPLFLLALVVFATLFFPGTLAKERTTIPVTGILTSAVLLISITNQLPALGYTVALEYIFYVFFMLCLMAMVTGFLSEILRNKQFHHHVYRIDLFGRVAYVLTVVLTIGVFTWKYSLAIATDHI